MKRASFSAALILCAVALLGWLFPALLFPLCVAGFLLGTVFLIVYRRRRGRLWRDLLFYAVCLFLCAVFLWFSVGSFYRTAEQYDGKTCYLTVELTEDPHLVSSGTYRYTVRPVDGTPFSEKFIFFCAAHLTDAGGRIRGEFTFERPKGKYFLNNLSDGVALTAKLETFWEELVVIDPEFSFTYCSGVVRRFVHTSFLRYIGSREGGFMTAVLTGNKDALHTEDYAALQETGMLHIVAVSGLHVSIFISFVMIFLRKIRSIRLRLLLSFITLFGILFFSGFTPSVVRAVVMNGLVFVHQWLTTGSDSLNRLGIAAILILLFSPYAVFSLSFQLSFAATLGILLLTRPIRNAVVRFLFVRCHLICGEALETVVSLFAVSVASFTFTLPLLWFLLGSFSVWSLLLSPVVLPVLELCFFGAMLLLLFVLIPYCSFLCIFLGTLIRYGVIFMTKLSTLSASLMGFVESVSPLVLWIVAGAIVLLAAVLFLIPGAKTTSKKKKKQNIRKGVALILLAVSLLTAYQAANQAGINIAEGEVAPDENVLQTVFLDVGQGNCFVSILNNQAYVVDCGGTNDPGRVASDYLTSAGIETVEFVLISHLHSDHANGLKDLCKEKEIKEIIIPYTEGDASLYATITALAAEEGATLTVLESDAERKLGSSTLKMLTKHLDPTSDDQNENSIVGLCQYGEFRALFTGDITKKAEQRLVDAYGSSLQCDVLSVPHHGSKGSSCAEFLKAANPVYAVISVAAKNSYGHPAQEALTRISAVEARILRTDESGHVTVRSDGQKMEVESERES